MPATAAHILYLSYDGMTDPLGQSQVIPYIKGLAKQGYRFSIVSVEKRDRLDRDRGLVQDQIAGQPVRWYPLVYYQTPPLLSTLWNYWRLKQKALEVAHQEKITICHCRSYITALIGLQFKRKYQTRFVFDMRGFWADERKEGNIWNLNNPLYRSIYRFFKRKERDFFRKSDHVISLTNNAKGVIENRFYNPSDRAYPSIQVIPCSVDTQLFSRINIDPGQLSRWKQKLAVREDDFVLTYLGSLGTWYMLDEMLLFYKQLLQTRPNAKFLFLTTEPPATVFKRAGKIQLPADQLIVQPVPYRQVPVLLRLTDLAIFFIKPTFSKKASSPTKQAEILSMGVPLICNAGIGDTDEIIGQSGAGLVLKELTEQSFREAVKKIDQLLDKPPEAIAALAKEKLSLEQGVRKYHQVYQKAGRS